MGAEQFTLIMILKEVIQNYHEKLESLKQTTVSPLTSHKEKIAQVREDVNMISEIDARTLEELVEATSLPEEDQKSIITFIRSIQTLLRLNKEKKTTFEIKETQLDYIKNFFLQLELLSEKSAAEENENMIKIGKMSTICSQYERLLDMIQDEQSTTYLDDPDLIASLMRECDLTDSTKRSILISIMKYNKAVFQRKIEEPEQTNHKIEEDQLQKVFAQYNYDFNELEKPLQEELLQNGNLKNIEGVLSALTENRFPRFNLENKGLKLTILLLKGNKDVIDNIANFCKKRGITPRELTNILPALLPQGDYERKGKKKNNSPEQGVLPTISGKSEDFIKNVEYLERYGLKASQLYSQCRGILVMNHQRLVTNLKAFQEYGFTLNNPKVYTSTLYHPGLCCLLSKNFAEMADQFIEISPLGHEYILNNPSRLQTILSPDDIVFYNIYASYMNQESDGSYQVAEGPFVNTKNGSTKPRLRGEITRYPGSGYEEIPYRGIEDFNKKEMTHTIDLPIKEKAKLDAAINRSYEEENEIIDILKDELDPLRQFDDQEDPIRYNIGGILISKPKVKRVFNILKTYGLENLEDSLLYAVTYNSIMNQEEFDRVKELIKGRVKK